MKEEEGDPGLAAGQGETILVAEDDLEILAMTANVLRKLGYRPLTAEGPEEALQIAIQYAGTIDLLLTDVIMPQMNGRELAARILQHHPGCRVLYVSGYSADVLAPHGILDEEVHFLAKPVFLKEMAAKIRSVLDE